MAKAIWNGEVIAESDRCGVVENNYYFPPKDVKMEFLKSSKMTSVCPLKGDAKYYDVVVNGKTNKDATWYYPNPKEKAKEIKGYVAFWRGVEVE